MMSESARPKLGLFTKVCYSLGDFTFSPMVQLTNAFALVFLTDVVMFSPAVAGSILFFGRILDAVSPPFVGAMIQKSSLRWGKYRPWLVIGAVFTLVFDTLFFIGWNPQVGSAGTKAIICCLVYAAFCIATNVLYTAYTSMNSALTTVPKERVQLSTLRVVGGSVGKILAGYFTVPILLVFSFGSLSPTQSGYIITALLTSFAMVVGYTLLAASTAKLDVRHGSATGASLEEPLTLGESFRFVLTNRPLVSLFIADVVRLLAYLVTLAMFPFFFIYVAKDPGATPMLMGTTAISLLAGALLMPFITKIVSRKTAYLIGLAVLAVSFVFARLFMNNTVVMVGMLVVGFVGYSFGSTITTAMYADVVDYGEVKYGKNARALYYSMFQLSIKVAAIFSTGISGFGLAMIGYIPNTEPSPAVVDGINFICLVLPIGLAVLAFVSLLFYNLNDRRMEQVRAELAQKRKG